jgi:prepilin-type N-terminal cleavage/methylation domain-containing protein
MTLEKKRRPKCPFLTTLGHVLSLAGVRLVIYSALVTLENLPVLRLRKASSDPAGGFTLVETLVVIALLALLSVLALPSLSSMNRSSELSQAGNNLADLSALAHQEALSRNIIAALMLFSTTDAQNHPVFMAAIAECAADGTWKQATKWISFSPVLKYSDTLIDSTGNTAPANAMGLPGGADLQMSVNSTIIKASNCETFIFYPDGRMDGAAGSARRLQVSYASDTTSTPVNYFQVLLDADNSALHIVRP